MLPEVKKYVDTLDEIDAAVKRLRGALDTITDDDQYHAARTQWRQQSSERPSKKYEAAQELARTSENKLVRYVVEHHLDDHDTEVTELLKVIDQGFKAMCKVADDAGWCSTWTEAVIDAHEAGVLDLTKVELHTFRVKRELWREMGQYETNRMMEYVEKLVEARVEEAVERLSKTASVVVDALTK